MISELAAAIALRLADTSVTAQLSNSAAVYNDQPAASAAYPYVIYRSMSAIDDNYEPHRTKNNLVQITAYSLRSKAEARAIDAAIDTLFHQVVLSVSGWSNFWLAREGDIDLTEDQKDGKTIYSAGGIYRVRISK